MNNIIDNKKFFNFRTKDEMSFLKRIVWQLFGEKLEHTADGYHVIAYRFKNVTLITKCEEIASEYE